ncbi:MAG: hypothetical protein JXA96_01045 [Sedimentisphaerales bacterium]|nr:hypothetical protein [Sedimentisphaerales bacterium]
MDNFDTDKPIPLDDKNSGKSGVSHSPLDLGGSRPVEINKGLKTQPKPVPVPVENKTITSNIQTISTGKIIGVKTFFTRLHAGALDFIDEQINDWIKKNPEKDIKQIQTVVGEIQAKKTEPSLIITIWY